MQGPYQKDGKWYFEAFTGLFGPYDTMEECLKDLNDLFDSGLTTSCPTCQED